MSQEELNIKNYMEEVVYGLFDDVLKDLNVCTCGKCRMDIAAIALNQLPAKYIVTEKGELYSKINTLRQQFEVDVISAITKAAVLVKRSPRHES
ncbi:MAG: late competence development ComFB family protein [Ignavibacteriales bacterium]